MKEVLVAGLINIETTLRVDGFPIPYAPVHYPFFGVQSTVSGVGYNIAKALTILGNPINFLSIIGEDTSGFLVRHALEKDHIATNFVLSAMQQTAQSVILYDKNGRRQIHADLKDIQTQTYPVEIFQAQLQQSELAILANINFTRPFLKLAKQAGKMVATDVHTIADLEDDYNKDYMAAADILFMSDEALPCTPEEWARRIQNQYGTEIVVIGLGGEGALLAVKEDNFLERIPAVKTRSIVNTIGAGDALFSCFNHTFLQTGDPYEAIKKAVVFASYKIWSTGAADGFLTEEELGIWVDKVKN